MVAAGVMVAVSQSVANGVYKQNEPPQQSADGNHADGHVSLGRFRC